MGGHFPIQKERAPAPWLATGAGNNNRHEKYIWHAYCLASRH
jgi:hypothetical protein